MNIPPGLINGMRGLYSLGIRNIPPQIRYGLIYSNETIFNSIRNSNKYIWHIAAPKSGSTWLDAILRNIFEMDSKRWEIRELVSSYDRKEQVIDARKLMNISFRKNVYFVHQHCRNCLETELFIDSANIIPFLQYRDIFDTVLSYYDHLNNESLVAPMAYMDDINWEIISDNKGIDYVIDMIIPWYFNFYAGWLSSDFYKEDKLFCIGYESLKKDTFSEVKKLLAALGMDYDDDYIKKAIDLSQGQQTRKNKAKVGRGNKLSEDQKEKIIRMAQYYPEIDFSIIGIK